MEQETQKPVPDCCMPYIPTFVQQEVKMNYQYQLIERFCRTENNQMSPAHDQLIGKEFYLIFKESGVMFTTTLLESNPNQYQVEKTEFLIGNGNHKILFIRDNKIDSVNLPEVSGYDVDGLTFETDDFVGHTGTCNEGETLVSRFH